LRGGKGRKGVEEREGGKGERRGKGRDGGKGRRGKGPCPPRKKILAPPLQPTHQRPVYQLHRCDTIVTCAH